MSGRKRRGVRIPRVWQPPGRTNWYVRIRWDGREVVRLAGSNESQASKRATRAYAMRVEGASLDEILSAVFGDPTGDHMTFEELAALYLDHVMKARTKRPSTIIGDVSRLQGLDKLSWAKRPLRSVSTRDIARWADARAREVKPATLARDLSMASAVFTWGIARGYVDGNPVRGVKRPSERGNARHLYLTGAQVHGLLDAAQEDLRPILLCAIHTGLRRGELFGLEWRDVDFERRVIRVRSENAKTKRVRNVPMTQELAETLGAAKDARKVFDMARGGGAVFVCSDGSAMNGNRLQKRWGKCLSAWRECPKGLRFHDLRHTAASLMINAGVDLFVVGNILGHSSAQTTKRYAHLVLDRQREAISMLSQSLRAKTKALG